MSQPSARVQVLPIAGSRCRSWRIGATAALLGLVGCALPDKDPEEDLLLQEAAEIDLAPDTRSLVVLLNPIVDTFSNRAVAPSGSFIPEVLVTNQAGTSARSDGYGYAILTGIASGYQVLTLESGNQLASLQGITVEESGITEVMISFSEQTAQLMSQVPFHSGQPLELVPTQSGNVTRTVISESDVVVVLPPGRVAGDVEISGSNVTLYGESFLDEWPIIEGDVVVTGSHVQVRGLWIGGDLQVDGNQFTMAYGGVTGVTRLTGPNPTLTDVVYCAPVEADATGILSVRGPTLPFTYDCGSR